MRITLESKLFSLERLYAADVVRRAAIERLRNAIHAEFARVEQPLVPGFDLVCVPATPFWCLTPAPTVVGRVVPLVDAAAVREAIDRARALPRSTHDVCLVLMAPELAPMPDIAAAMAEQRRKAMPAGRLTLIPLDTRHWKAHVPTDVPPPMASLVSRLATV